ncbi:hypothetical protein [Teichococcus wenyumeiae]|uniref:hypothetical protein n=1 Tax=Teichococcus wenyumeiae TaxID=2478470 RepID=UPI0018F48DC9|nr:hypothetical protein [Pseudoroseomonas wenyumeiae]
MVAFWSTMIALPYPFLQRVLWTQIREEALEQNAWPHMVADPDGRHRNRTACVRGPGWADRRTEQMRSHEGFAQSCIVAGFDVGGPLHTITVMGWLMLISLLPRRRTVGAGERSAAADHSQALMAECDARAPEDNPLRRQWVHAPARA